MVGISANIFVYSGYSVTRITTEKSVKYFYNNKEKKVDDLYASSLIKALKCKTKIVKVYLKASTRAYKILKKENISNLSEKETELVSFVAASDKIILANPLGDENEITLLKKAIKRKIAIDEAKKKKQEEDNLPPNDNVEKPNESKKPPIIIGEHIIEEEIENPEDDNAEIINDIIVSEINTPNWQKVDVVDLNDI